MEIDNNNENNVRVLEIGSGTGLLGILIRKMGIPIYLSDYDNDALVNLRNNLKLNKLASENVYFLDWRETYNQNLGKFDCIIGADVMYCKCVTSIEDTVFENLVFNDNQDDVLNVLEQYLDTDGVAHLFVNEGRTSINDFLNKAKVSFEVEKNPVNYIPEQQCSFNGQLFNLVHIKLKRLYDRILI